MPYFTDVDFETQKLKDLPSVKLWDQHKCVCVGGGVVYITPPHCVVSDWKMVLFVSIGET